jgi:acyl-CoA synthetase (NDP forming)
MNDLLTIMKRAREEGRTVLTEFESKRILKRAGVPVVETKLARNQKEAVSISQKIGFPVVLKIVSPDVVHKTDAGGVKLGLENVSEVKKAYNDILTSVKKQVPRALIHGISVQKMARPGIEVIIGASQDPQFGPVIMFGLGGIFVEVLRDVSFRIVPVGRRDAIEMIKETKGYPLLKGYRGKEPVNLFALVDVILKVSDLVGKNQAIKELDLNPIFAYKQRALAVDARILLRESNEANDTE